MGAYIHLIPIGVDGSRHQQSRECFCSPLFGIDVRGTLPSEDTRVILHRDPAVSTAEQYISLRAAKGKFVELSE